MSDCRVTAPYSIGFHHFLALAVCRYTRANRGPIRGWLSVLIPAVTAICLALAGLRPGDGTGSAMHRFLISMLCACLIFLGWFAFIFLILLCHGVMAWRKWRKDPRVTTLRVVSLDADGVEMIRADDRKVFTWQQVTDIYRSMGCIFMPLDNGQCHIIPASALQGAAAATSFYNKAVEYKALSPIVSVFSAPAPDSTPRA